MEFTNPHYDMAEASSIIRWANDQLLAASRQGGFLSAALIATTPLWSVHNNNEPVPQLAAIGISVFVLSILCSIAVHFIVGLSTIKTIRKILAMRTENIPFYIKSAWLLAFLQAILFLGGIVMIVISYTS